MRGRKASRLEANNGNLEQQWSLVVAPGQAHRPAFGTLKALNDPVSVRHHDRYIIMVVRNGQRTPDLRPQSAKGSSNRWCWKQYSVGQAHAVGNELITTALMRVLVTVVAETLSCHIRLIVVIVVASIVVRGDNRICVLIFQGKIALQNY